MRLLQLQTISLPQYKSSMSNSQIKKYDRASQLIIMACDKIKLNSNKVNVTI